MTARTAEPLPECALCEAPTARQAYTANGGLCTACTSGIADTVRMLPVRSVLDLDAARARRVERAELDDQTAYVERWTPPVPGQLSLPDDGDR